jgi:hypothetical protein
MAFHASIAELLAYRSAHICNNPECNTLTIGPSTNDPELKLKAGEAAHMEGEGVKSARHNPNITASVNKIENGIWLCTHCHTLIDKADGVDYPLTTLQAWKVEHEELINGLLRAHKSPLPLIRRQSINHSIAQNVVDDACNRGALYRDWHMEDGLHVIESICAFRKEVGKELKRVESDARLRKTLQGIQATCKAFMNGVSGDRDGFGSYLDVMRRTNQGYIKKLVQEYKCTTYGQLSAELN